MTTKHDLLKFLEATDRFKDFEEKLSKLDNEKLKGDLFELFCQAYLETIHSQDFKKVQLFKDITDSSIFNRLNVRSSKDYGIDIVAITDSNRIWAVQAKFRGKNVLTWSELGTFRGISEKADFTLVMGNINQILHPHKQLLNFSAILRFDFEKLIPEDFKRIRNYLGHHEKINELQPREHQKKAIEKAGEHFKENDKGQMIHACGTGKTLTALWIKEHLKPKNALVFVPSLALLKQTLEEWFKNRKDKFSLQCVCSDPTVTKSEIDQPIIDNTELGAPVTTTKEEIIEFLKDTSSHSRS